MFLSIPELTEEHRPDIAANVIIKVTSYCMSEVLIGFYPGSHHLYGIKLKSCDKLFPMAHFVCIFRW